MSEENSGSEQEESTADAQNLETVLYCFPREATTVDDLENLSEALEEAGFELNSSDGEGENILVQRSAEASEELNVSDVL